VHEVEVLGSGKRLGLQRPRVEVGRTAQADLQLVGYKGVLAVTAEISGTPLEAEVFVGGEKLGTTPLQKRVAPGELEVAISGAGKTGRRRLTLEPGGQMSLEVDFAEAGGFDGSTPGWVSIGIGAASGAGSALAFAMASTARDEADAASSEAELEAAVSDGQTFETAGVAAGAAAGGLVLLGLILHLLDEDAPAPAARVTPDGEGVVGVAGRF
jgi:hypothetical protein